MPAGRTGTHAAVTAYDGAVRPGHPVLARALGRVHSATSLRSLLRNPLGFTWHYALGWREPDAGVEALELDALQFGSLVHALLDAALPAIQAAGGLARGRPGHDRRCGCCCPHRRRCGVGGGDRRAARDPVGTDTRPGGGDGRHRPVLAVAAAAGRAQLRRGSRSAAWRRLMPVAHGIPCSPSSSPAPICASRAASTGWTCRVMGARRGWWITRRGGRRTPAC